MAASTIIVLLLAAVLAGAFVGVLPAWRQLMSRGADLPLWKFARRRGLRREAVENTLGARAVVQAELRCALCAAQTECEKRLASPGGAPVAHCPNTRLFPLIQAAP
jgi:hypothetical protein